MGDYAARDKQDTHEPLGPLSAQFQWHDDLCAHSKSSESCLGPHRMCYGQALLDLENSKVSSHFVAFLNSGAQNFARVYWLGSGLASGGPAEGRVQCGRRGIEKAGMGLGQEMPWPKEAAGCSLLESSSSFSLSSFEQIPVGHLWIIFGESS